MLLHHEFIKTAKRYGPKTAIIDRYAQRSLTYSQTLAAVLILAARLGRLPDKHIGIMIPNSAGAILSILGTLSAGKVPVMINYATGALENTRYAQEMCGFEATVTSRALLDKLGCEPSGSMVFIEEMMRGVSLYEKIRAALLARLPAGVILSLLPGSEMDDDVVILFTSGSEKQPKGVRLTHRNIGSNVNSMTRALDVGAHDVMLCNLPLFHVYGHSVNLWLPIACGMTMVTCANPLEFRRVTALIREEKVTVLGGTPFFLRGYLKKSDPGDFDGLRLVIVGADKAPESLRRGFEEKHGIEIYEGYGTTETSPVVSANLPGANRPGSIGRPIPGVEVKIVDLDTGQELPAGSEGKIMVKGDLVMKGYVRDPEETRNRIKDGWYDTGDMGLLDEDGYLWHRGRLRRFVKIGGEMVSLVRTEDVLEDAIAQGVEYCVVDIPDDVKGAQIVAAVSKEINEKEVLKKMSERLHNISLPRQFVVIDELPKMGSGKVDFRTTTEMVMEILRASNND